MTTGSPAVGEDPGEVRRAEILEAAAAVFAEKGYPRATMKEIAGQAGIAPGTIYLYFKNKRDLLLAIADRVIGEAWAQAQAEMVRIDPEAYIAAILEGMFHFACQEKAFLQAIAAELWTDEELQERFFTKILQPLFATAGHYLEAQIEDGNARDCRVEIVIPTVAGSLIILSIMRALAPEDFLAGYSEEEVVDELTRLYFYGLRLAPEETTE